MLVYEDLFQKPLYYHPSSLTIQPALAAEIASVERMPEYGTHCYRSRMLEPPQDFGPGFQESGQNVGFGASFTNPAEALAKSVFEAWERKFSKVFDRTSLIQGSFNELAPRAVNPADFGLISEWEHRQSPLSYSRFSPDQRLSWKECFQVSDRSLRSVLIPATLVYSRFSWRNPAERFVPNLSPGLAAHATYREAFLNGLCELLERDAFMLNWLHHRSPPRIQLETIAFGEAEKAHKVLQTLGFIVHFLNLTTDIGIPVIVTLIEHPGLPWNGTLVPGLGCHLDPLIALRKSFLEALVLLTNFATINADRSEVLLKRRPLPFGLQPAEYFRNVRFLMDSSNSVGMDHIASHDRKDSGRNLEFLIKHLNKLGHASYFVDLTPPGYENCRLCLTRAFIAGLQPMLYEPDCWRLSAQRLFGDQPPAFERLNLMPHPFMLME